MIEKASVLDDLWPGRRPGIAPNLRPLLRRGLHRRLHMFSMLNRARPDRCDDPAGFAALLGEIEARPSGWRERFFDDVEVAAWIMGLGPAASADAAPISVAPLQAMVREHDGSPVERGPGPMLLPEDGPHHLLAAIAESFARDGKTCAIVGLATRQRLQSRLADQFGMLAARWPEMAAMARQHIAAIAIVDQSCSLSNLAFPGTVVWGGADIFETSPKPEVDFGEYLVHETIHQALYCLQEIHPLLKPGVAGSFKSPWSGRQRPLAAASHIPLVYFAILEYLTRSTTLEPNSRTRDRRQQIVAGMDGFYGAGLGRAQMTDWGRALHDQIREAFEARRSEFLA